jgi:hypothetical protein
MLTKHMPPGAVRDSCAVRPCRARALPAPRMRFRSHVLRLLTAQVHD